MSVEQPANFGGSAKNMIRDADRAKQAAAEDMMAEILEGLGLLYHRQYHYAKGRRLRADFAVWSNRTRNIEPLALIEIVGGIFSFGRTRKDGTKVIAPGAHGTTKGILADIDRLNEATLNGWRMLRFTPDMVMVRDGRARETLERLLK